MRTHIENHISFVDKWAIKPPHFLSMVIPLAVEKELKPRAQRRINPAAKKESSCTNLQFVNIQSQYGKTSSTRLRASLQQGWAAVALKPR
jgi:hypothetical protein